MSRELDKNDFTKKGRDNSLYPTISVNYNISETQMLTFGLKQNLTRPSFKFYNPFKYLYTPTMLVKGNPDLKASRTTAADLTYILQPSQSQMYMLNGGISYTEKLIFPGMEVDSLTKILIFSQQNLGDLQEIYLYLTAQKSFTKWFSLYTSLMVSQDKYIRMSDSLKGNSENHPAMALSVNGSIVLPMKVNFHFMYNFNSSSITAQGKNLSTHFVNFTFDRSFLKDKIGTSLTITNPFHSMKNVQEYNTPLMKLQYKTFMESAVFRLGLSYKFGTVKKSTIQKQNAIINTRL
ncbi:MAG: outer membrane beta-barrel protein, partial [Bacteroidota bacterium]|nr:outer membrane beta-barrel protein [Bacteroidota bacterium]